MRLGLVSDIHGNAAALGHALNLMGTVDRVICLGDAIEQSRFSNEVVRLLRERDAIVVRGNHEDMFFSPAGARARAAPWIDAEALSWLQRQPQELRLDLAGRSILLVHSTSWHPRGLYVTPNHPHFDRFAECGCDFVFYGHTHVAVRRRVGATHVVNPGSCGEATAATGGAHGCAVVDLATGDVSLIAFTREGVATKKDAAT